jgi:thymidine kinase
LIWTLKEILWTHAGSYGYAEYVTKVHAVCTRTGNLANYSFRKTDNEKLVMLGETEEYEPLSRAAYYHAMRKIRGENRNPLRSPSKGEGD